MGGEQRCCLALASWVFGVSTRFAAWTCFTQFEVLKLSSVRGQTRISLRGFSLGFGVLLLGLGGAGLQDGKWPSKGFRVSFIGVRHVW